MPTSWSGLAHLPYHPPHARPLDGPPPGLEIRLASGVGTAPTMLAAFDAALREIGVANYNLIRLSSVIPPGSLVTVSAAPLSPSGNWGDRLYVVTADMRTDVLGAEVWAGIGCGRTIPVPAPGCW